MPYVRRRYTRKTYTRRKKVAPRRRYVRKARGYMSRLRPELKKKDLQISTTVDIAGPYIGSLVNLDIASTDAGRIGNAVAVKSLYCRMKITPADPVNSFRMLLVVDKQQVSDSAPTVGDLLDGDAGSNLIAPLNNQTVGRFTVLLDRILQVDRSAASAQGVIYTSFYKKCNIPVRFNGVNGTDIQKNGIYLFVITDDVAADPDPSILATVRTSYYDI